MSSIPDYMKEILKSLSGLSPFQCLKVIHSRESFALYLKLAEAG